MEKRIPIKYLYNMNPFYVHLKKHYCPNCKELLIRDYDSKIVNSYSPEAKEYNFAIGAGDSYYKGDVEFRISFFRCPKCNLKIPFDEIKEIEQVCKKHKVKKRRKD